MTNLAILTYLKYEKELEITIKEPNVRAAIKTGYISALYYTKQIDRADYELLAEMILNEMYGSNI